MTTHSRFVALVVLLCAAVSSVVNAQHADHAAMLKQRGAAAMGFDQDKAVHHFLVMPDGGTIQVEARDTADIATLAAIRTHLRQIAISFSQATSTRRSPRTAKCLRACRPCGN